MPEERREEEMKFELMKMKPSPVEKERDEGVAVGPEEIKAHNRIHTQILVKQAYPSQVERSGPGAGHDPQTRAESSSSQNFRFSVGV